MYTRDELTHDGLRKKMEIFNLEAPTGICNGTTHMFKEAVIFRKRNKFYETLEAIKKTDNFCGTTYDFLKAVHKYQYYSPSTPSS